MAGVALMWLSQKSGLNASSGITLVELVIVVVIVGILLTMAAPGYKAYMLRVHRSDAVRMLLNAVLTGHRS
jgi:prepilin-type N-terminal cleavage/methylation domain-containing protein